MVAARSANAIDWLSIEALASDELRLPDAPDLQAAVALAWDGDGLLLWVEVSVGGFAHVPTWVFHGARDTVVPVRASEEMVEAMRAAGAEVKFTVYPEAGHDSWTEAYDNAELYDWLLSQRR